MIHQKLATSPIAPMGDTRASHEPIKIARKGNEESVPKMRQKRAKNETKHI